MAEKQSSSEFPILDNSGSRVPIRFRTMVIAVGALVICAAATVFGTAYTVNKLQTMLADEARDETEQAATELCNKIRDVVLEESNGNLASLAVGGALENKLKSVCGNRDVAMAAVLDNDGKVLFYRACGATMAQTFHQGELSTAPMQAGDPPGFPYAYVRTHLPASVVPMRFPISSSDGPLGFVDVGLRSQASLFRINELSTEITASLVGMVLTVFAILLLTIVLIYYSARRQMELMTRTAEAEHLVTMGALASGLAHEIRSPLHAMNLHLDVLREEIESGDADREDSEQCLETVQKQIGQLNKIVSNFLCATMPCQIRPVPMSLNSMIDEVGVLLKPEMHAQGIDFQVELPPVSVMGDAPALQQVMLNLMVNARQVVSKHTGTKAIRVSAEEFGDKWRIYLDDSGPGIPKGKEDCIFRSFFTKRCGATGFGLSIARRIVEAHHGTIHATKSPLGGTRIVMELQKAAAGASNAG